MGQRNTKFVSPAGSPGRWCADQSTPGVPRPTPTATPDAALSITPYCGRLRSLASRNDSSGTRQTLLLRLYNSRERSADFNGKERSRCVKKAGTIATRPSSMVLLLAVMLGMAFCRFLCVMGGMHMVSMRSVGMVRGFLVSTGFVVLCRFLVMTSGVLVMLGGFFVMFCCLFGHGFLR